MKTVRCGQKLQTQASMSLNLDSLCQPVHLLIKYSLKKKNIHRRWHIINLFGKWCV